MDNRYWEIAVRNLTMPKQNDRFESTVGRRPGRNPSSPANVLDKPLRQRPFRQRDAIRNRAPYLNGPRRGGG